jgi:hypothetical protein
MTKKLLFLPIGLLLISSVFAGLKSDLKGGKIIAEDGTFLGKIEGKYSSDSIFNEYGTYGSEYSSQSPFNKYSSTPPKIYTVKNKWIYLTANTSLSPRISVLKLRALFED